MTITALSAGIGPNRVLAICCLSQLVVGMDVTIVNVALPAISGLASMTFAIIEGHQEGWGSARIVGLLIFASGALAGSLLCSAF